MFPQRATLRVQSSYIICSYYNCKRNIFAACSTGKVSLWCDLESTNLGQTVKIPGSKLTSPSSRTRQYRYFHPNTKFKEVQSQWHRRVFFSFFCALLILKMWKVRWPYNWFYLTPERAVWVQALAGDIALCSWARHFTLTVCIKWVATNLMLGGGVTRRRTSIPYRGSRHTPSLFMLQKPG